MFPSLLLADGFLPTRGTWMLDFVVVAMAGISIVLAYSIYQIRVKKNPRRHRMIQIVTAIVLTFALIAFEVDVRLITTWRELAEPSPYYPSGMVDRCLLVHLLFAVPTPFIWGFVIWSALKNFKTGFRVEGYNRIHRIWGRIAAAFMYLTAITGWVFYYVAFIA